MEKTVLIEKITEIRNKREFLLGLLEKPDLGALRIDVNQALDELDELIEEFEITFPEKRN
jgi:hypothetical protein